MDEITINLDDSPIISQPSPVLLGQDSPVIVQENFVGGKSATIQIGSVETLPYGSEAYVDNVGTETDAIFNFGIPEGQRGEQGVAGSDGVDGEAATIQIGTVSTGLPNSAVTFENVGTPTNAIFDISIPRGVQGETGETGAAGADGISPIAYVTQISNGATIHIEDSENVTDATVYNGTDGQDGSDGFSPIAAVTQNTGSATISITDANGTTTATVYDGQTGQTGQAATVTVGSTTTGNAGTNASVTNSGTSSAAVLDFVIPRGNTGAAGADGADGFSPVATVTQGTGSATITITDKNGTTSATVHDGITPTVSSVTLTKNANRISGTGYSYAKKYGKVVTVCLNFSTSTTVASRTKLFTVSEHPIQRTTFCVAGNSKGFRMYIEPNGEVYNEGSLDAAWFDGEVIYFTN